MILTERYELVRNSNNLDPANQPLRVNCPCSQFTATLDDMEVCTYFNLDPGKRQAFDRVV